MKNINEILWLAKLAMLENNIGCVNENVPSIEDALIESSEKGYKEIVQL